MSVSWPSSSVVDTSWLVSCTILLHDSLLVTVHQSFGQQATRYHTDRHSSSSSSNIQSYPSVSSKVVQCISENEQNGSLGTFHGPQQQQQSQQQWQQQQQRRRKQQQQQQQQQQQWIRQPECRATTARTTAAWTTSRTAHDGAFTTSAAFTATAFTTTTALHERCSSTSSIAQRSIASILRRRDTNGGRPQDTPAATAAIDADATNAAATTNAAKANPTATNAISTTTSATATATTTTASATGSPTGRTAK